MAVSLLVVGATACGPVAPRPAPLQELSAVTARSRRLERELRRQLRDLSPLKFIDHRSSVITGEPPGQVNNGVVVTLGPIRGSTTRVEIGSSIWNNGLDAKWLTYVVVLHAGRWQIAGTTGPIAVA